MFDSLDRARLLRFRVAHPNLLVELLVNRDVNELVNGGRNHRSPVFAVKDRQIAAPADEAHPQRSATDDHLAAVFSFSFSFSVSVRISRIQSPSVGVGN